MALINCPECQRQISDLAPTCPGCGYPMAGGTAKTAPKPVEPPQQVTTPQAAHVPPAPSVEPTNPEALRERLLGDLSNTSLRKHYLIVRTPALKQQDRLSVPANRYLFFEMVGWSIYWALLPFVFLVAGSFLMVMAYFRNLNQLNGVVTAEAYGRLFGHGLFIAGVSGLFLGFAGFVARGIAFLRLRNRCEELGPLPDNAPLNAAVARERFLNG